GWCCCCCVVGLLVSLPDTAPIDVSALSLHDALPISSGGCPARQASRRRARSRRCGGRTGRECPATADASRPPAPRRRPESSCWRSEEHTSELQSRENLVCRLLLEKKKTTTGTEQPRL